MHGCLSDNWCCNAYSFLKGNGPISEFLMTAMQGAVIAITDHNKR